MINQDQDDNKTDQPDVNSRDDAASLGDGESLLPSEDLDDEITAEALDQSEEDDVSEAGFDELMLEMTGAVADHSSDGVEIDGVEIEDEPLLAASEDLPAGGNELTPDVDELDPLLLPEQLTLSGKIEAIVFASPKPMRAVEIHDLLLEFGHTLKEVQDACDELTEFYRDRAGGLHLKYIKRMGYQFQTTPAAKTLMERQFSSRPRPLSRAALETLAVIAYRQKQSKGVTRAEVEFIRGVDAGSIFKTLVERNLLTCTGRKEIPGRPMIFGVTDDFLRVFQLGSINDLPPLESFQTPKDVLDAANQKIAEFEAEQEGVDTNEFINDEEYAADVQSAEDFNALTAVQPAYAPTLARLNEVIEAVAASASDTIVEKSLEVEASADLLEDLGEGQVAWVAPEVHTEQRSLQGAVVERNAFSMDSINEDEWDSEGDNRIDNKVQVVMTATESADTSLVEVSGDIVVEASSDAVSEAQSDERNEITEVAFPTGGRESPRGGDVDK
jgi:segregation and condensation protein B